MGRELDEESQARDGDIHHEGPHRQHDQGRHRDLPQKFVFHFARL